MQLLKLEVVNFRRFVEASVVCDGILSAIVGPNEAGKSSILEAFALLNTGGRIPPASRSVAAGEQQTSITARFALSQDEIDEVAGAQNQRVLVRDSLDQDGETVREVSFDPPISRAVDQVRALVRGLNQASSSSRMTGLLEQKQPDLLESIDDVLGLLTELPKDLGDGDLEDIGQLAVSIREVELAAAPKYWRDIPDRLDQVGAVYSATHPEEIAREKIEIPEFIEFADVDRQIESLYNVRADDQPTKTLANLLALGGSSHRELIAVLDSNHSGRLKTLEESMNERIASTLESWTQREIRVVLSLELRGILRISIGEDSGELFDPPERSDGLRWFVALLAFLVAESRGTNTPPILLVDEAETHLHYDAQADLVRELATQDLASAVVYSTHSVGCLPADLTQVRTVVPIGRDTSTVENWFWNLGEERLGTRNLVLGMGARTLGLVSSQGALITEGVSDLVLWPRFVRDATGSDLFEYQVVPGLADAGDEAAILMLDLHAARTSYLTDDDDEGRSYRRKLINAGIDDRSILAVSGSKGIEDLLESRVFAGAVNESFRISGTEFTVSAGDVPSSGRAMWLRNQVVGTEISAPSKVHIAHHAIRLSNGQRILDKRSIREVAEIHQSVVASIGILRR